MFASRFSRAAGLAIAVVSGLLLSSASYANSYEQLFPGRGYSAPSHHSRAYYGGGSYSSYGSTPRDFVSSHVCTNGYRWITRDLDRGWENPAQNAIPVRC